MVARSGRIDLRRRPTGHWFGRPGPLCRCRPRSALVLVLACGIGDAPCIDGTAGGPDGDGLRTIFSNDGCQQQPLNLLARVLHISFSSQVNHLASKAKGHSLHILRG